MEQYDDRQNGYVKWRHLVSQTLVLVGLMVTITGGITAFILGEISAAQEKANQVPTVRNEIESVNARLDRIENKIDQALYNGNQSIYRRDNQ